MILLSFSKKLIKIFLLKIIFVSSHTHIDNHKQGNFVILEIVNFFVKKNIKILNLIDFLNLQFSSCKKKSNNKF